MNNLSWLLWFGDVSGSLSSFLFFMAFPLFFTVVVLTIAGYCYKDESSEGSDSRMGKSLHNVGFGLALPLFFVCSIVSCLLPSKDTVYLIAASETGEQVIKSPTGQKALDAVNRYLDSVAKKNDPTRKDEDNDNSESK